MLLNGFYNVNQLDQLTDNKYLAQITLNPRHEIFKGHFPGNPVTPGVCMMQIIKELLEEILHTELRMTASSNVKFMAIINPETNPELVLELDLSGDLDTEIKVKNTTKFGDTVALKLTNTYRKA
ncbi:MULTISPECIES: 3-hydroxyacyl-ACP dehydratase [Flavobacterium]|uniref:3-hydroxyacyl-ACP dehydratase n=1 Tax=Flavobacterium TaxID=237 RepID=UPI000B5B9FB0|nr:MULTISPECIES: 3-hydroxyacyl-ACP dehydratase [Flavobacterium]MCJ1806686.1 3-hydroxyacyl-ACP dehydratase [Flavobacterium covae]OXA81519.1 3-hydroxyacyl-ACP dehydratase [Flavobacterium columnare NBRC 100251 = ATCC 23463]